MIAVYKRELRSYLTSMIGYLFIFFILFLTGIYFSAYQLGAAYPRFEYTLSALTFVSTAHDKIRNSISGSSIHCDPWIFPSGMCKSCNWCVYFLIDRKSGNCGSTDICYSVCFLYDEWNFLFLLRRSTFYLCYIWTSDSGSRDHNLYNDQKLPDLSSHLCSWGDRTCHCLCCKFQLFLRWNPENSGYLQPEQPL